MLRVSSDAAWERYGQVDPYFGVVSHEKFHAENLDGGAYAEFFRSGEEHVASVLDTIRERLDPGFRPGRALDFGCGVGRILIPLARVADTAVGVDVSESMLREARRNAESWSVPNVELVRSDDRLSRLTGTFDLIHSFIVFQHIPPRRGMALLRGLLDHLAEGGVGALHFTYARRAPLLRKGVNWLRGTVPFVNSVVNLAQGRPASYPLMQMNNYTLSRIFSVLQDAGCEQGHYALTEHGGHLGVMLYVRRRSSAGG